MFKELIKLIRKLEGEKCSYYVDSFFLKCEDSNSINKMLFPFIPSHRPEEYL